MNAYREDASSVRHCFRHGITNKDSGSLAANYSSQKQRNFNKGSLFSDLLSTMAAVFRIKHPKTILWFFGICFLLVFYITISSFPSDEPCNCKHQYDESLTSGGNLGTGSMSHPEDPHKMAILIPFRDRFEELLEFAPYINSFLNKQKRNHHIFVINQIDNLRFNRASLLNIGYLESASASDYIAMHDVDLLPMNTELPYQFPETGPYHVAAPHLHPRYHYPTFIGGILLISRKDFANVDGLSNKYWGWGLEDDELYARLTEAQLTISRPGNLTTGTKDTFKHIHDRRIRKRDMIKCYNQQEVTRKRDRETGLSTLRYHVQNRKEMTIQGAPVSIINVILECNKAITPWCDCTENIGNTKTKRKPGERSNDVIVPKLDRRRDVSVDG
ncbi:unnamed protein product [Meganyctiphanes norvegica]|uniref:Beta-1,4-N-acetylgalactosaminyltransferase n=1 Tax=Meganyctiphanes norvegica TaxID=48144 RepID=A0AAV2QGV2_MEGNR